MNAVKNPACGCDASCCSEGEPDDDCCDEACCLAAENDYRAVTSQTTAPACS